MSAHLSFSQLSRFDECPYRYWQVYRNPEGGREPATDAMRAGTQLHNETYYKLERGLWDKLPARWESWMKTRFADPETGCVSRSESIEQKYVIQLDGGDTEFVAYLDLTRDNALVDFKSNEFVKNADGSVNELQIKTYALAVMLHHGYERIHAWLVSINKEFYRHFEYDAETLQEHWLYLQMRADFIRLEYEWPATPGDHCAECQYKTDCPARERFGRFFRQLDEAFDYREALEAVRWARAMDKATREKLKQHMQKHGLTELTHDGERIFASPSVAYKMGKD